LGSTVYILINGDKVLKVALISNVDIMRNIRSFENASKTTTLVSNDRITKYQAKIKLSWKAKNNMKF